MIAVDTCILIWGVREHSQAGREDMIVRCKRLIDDHKARRIPIMVPAIVLAEYLARFDADEQLKQRETIARNFFVAPFDNEGAWQAGALFDKDRIRAIKANGTPKQCVHADLNIIATAIAHGAVELYTDNVADFKSLAQGQLLIREVPEYPAEQAEIQFPVD